jgi:lysophospholipid acyltransferase (LPLAT)-like uncharacterized protein
MLKRIARYPRIQAAIGAVLAGYLKFVRLTTRFTWLDPNSVETLKRDDSFICAIWHGQNFMIPLAMWEGAKVAVLITRHGDGAVVAEACERMGMTPIRASGGSQKQKNEKGGAAGLRAMIGALDEGYIVAMTPDAPKTARVAVQGIIALARLSGRPIRPICVATSRRIDLNNWDRTSICLPFGRGAIAVGDAIMISRDADAETQEQVRLQLERDLDAMHDRAYAYLGTVDPGLGLRANRI